MEKTKKDSAIVDDDDDNVGEGKYSQKQKHHGKSQQKGKFTVLGKQHRKCKQTRFVVYNLEFCLF